MKTKPLIHKIAVSEYRLDLRGKSFASLLPIVSNGKKSLQFDTYAEAERKADEIAKLLQSHGKSRLENVSRILTDDIPGLYSKLAPFNATLGQAVDHYIKHLVTIRQAEATETVEACVMKWLEAKEAEKEKGTLRPRTLETLKFYGKKFKAQWGTKKIGTLTKHEIKSWLEGLSIPKPGARLAVSSTYEKHHLNHLSQLFIWVRHNGQPTLVNPCEEITVKSETAEPVFFTVEQATKLLRLLNQDEWIDLLPYHAICLFAGVRPKECERLTWGEIDFDDACIVMTKGNAKTRTGRRPELHATLVSWLKHFQAKFPKAPLIPADFKRKIAGFREAYGNWEHNVMRHSFSSYYLAGIKKDFGALEAMLGNSRLILQKHYVRFPSKDAASQFWGLTPKVVLKDQRSNVPRSPRSIRA